MRQAVTTPGNPPANHLGSLGVAAAAKTGTAQTGKAYTYHSWVVVFAPYDDPQILLTLMVENAKGAPGSLPSVLPVAREVLDWWFSPRQNED